MQVIFTQNEIKEATATVKRYKFIWWLSFAVYAALMIGMFALFSVQVGVFMDRTMKVPFMVISIIASIIFFGYTIMAYDLKYRYAKARKRMFDDIHGGVKERSEGTVIEIDMTPVQKDDVWFYSLIVECAPIRREQQNIRRLLIERGRPAPDLRANDKIEFVIHAGILIGYEKKDNS